MSTEEIGEFDAELMDESGLAQVIVYALSHGWGDGEDGSPNVAELRVGGTGILLTALMIRRLKCLLDVSTEVWCAEHDGVDARIYFPEVFEKKR